MIDNKKSSFRSDINALRAVAVIAVVIYHFNSSWLSGGFAGVDVFFVISGYLMTSIIVADVNQNRFSFLKYYKNRAQRIVPPLAVLLLVLVLYGYLFLTPVEYYTLSKHALSSLSFISNFTFWREAGYFDVSASNKWLLHTWSLSAEWQFYTLFPIFVILLLRFFSFSVFKIVFVITTILLLVFSIYATYRWPNPSYFLLPTRAWEMMIGGVVFLFPLSTVYLNKWGRYLQPAGILLILLSYFFINSDYFWPGYLAMIPVSGSVLIILSSQQSSWLLSNKLFQIVGKSSYSIYLWHWPIFVFFTSLNLDGYYFTISFILLSFIMGFFAYWLIEKKNLLNFGTPLKFFFSLKKLPLFIFFIFTVVFISNGALFRLDNVKKEIILSALAAKNDWNYPSADERYSSYPVRNTLGEVDSDILFIGDSLIEQYYPVVSDISQKSNYNVKFITQGGCMPISGMSKVKHECYLGDLVTSYIEDKYFSKIIIGGFWQHYLLRGKEYSISSKDGIDYNLLSPTGKRIILNRLEGLYKYLSDRSEELYFILPSPSNMRNNPDNIIDLVMNDDFSYKLGIKASEIVEPNIDFYDYMIEMSNKYNITLLDPMSDICKDGICAVIDADEKPIYKDNIHLRSSFVTKNIHLFKFLESELSL